MISNLHINHNSIHQVLIFGYSSCSSHFNFFLLTIVTEMSQRQTEKHFSKEMQTNYDLSVRSTTACPCLEHQQNRANVQLL